METNSSQNDDSHWNEIDRFRTSARSVDANDETRQKAAERFFGQEFMIRAACLILSYLRRGRNYYECQFAEDMLHDIFGKVMQGIAGFSGGTEKEFWGWLWQVVRHTSIDCGRSWRKESPIANQVTIVVERASGDNPFQRVVLREWFDALSDRQRSIVMLRADGHTIEEVAKILGLSRSLVHRDLTGAHKLLTAIMHGRTAQEDAGPKVRKKEKTDEH